MICTSSDSACTAVLHTSSVPCKLLLTPRTPTVIIHNLTTPTNNIALTKQMKQFLEGAHDMDRHFLEAPLRQNLPVLMGLLGVWNSTFLGHGTRALLPYSQALLRFAAHIQQVLS